MEVDTSVQILDWAAIWLGERKYLTKESDREGHVVFYDDYITLHHANCQKDSRKVILQRVSIKGNHATYTWG